MDRVDEALLFCAEQNADGACFPEAKTVRSVPGGRLVEKHEVGINLMSEGQGVRFSSIKGLPQQSARACFFFDGGDGQPTGFASRSCFRRSRALFALIHSFPPDRMRNYDVGIERTEKLKAMDSGEMNQNRGVAHDRHSASASENA
jgi:hypothetical protein